MARYKRTARKPSGGYNGLLSKRPTLLHSPTSTLSSDTQSSFTALGRLSSKLSQDHSDTTEIPDSKSTTRVIPVTTSTLSSIPSMLQSPDVAMFSASGVQYGQNPRLAQIIQDQYVKRVDDDAKQRLDQDQRAISKARGDAMKCKGWIDWSQEERSREQERKALLVIEERKRDGTHVSCKYPLFKDFVPLLATGNSRGYKDTAKYELLEQQKAMSRRAPVPARGRSGHDEDDHEEMPKNIKKLEGGIKRELSDIKEYTEPHEARFSRGRANAHSNNYDEDLDSEEDSEEDDSEDTGSEEDNTIQVRHRRAQTGSARNAHAVESDSEDEAAVPLVAVSRGMPLPEGAAMPALKEVDLKQRFATGVRCVEHAVIRGQVPTQDDSNKSNLKKRGSERDGCERYGGSFGAMKRAKVEVAI